MNSTAESPTWYVAPGTPKSPKERLVDGERKGVSSVLQLRRKPMKIKIPEADNGSNYELLDADDRSIVDKIMERLQIVPSCKEDDVIRDILLKYPKYESWTKLGYRHGKGITYSPELRSLADVVKDAWSAERRDDNSPMRESGEYVSGKPNFNDDQRKEMIAEVFAEKKAA